MQDNLYYIKKLPHDIQEYFNKTWSGKYKICTCCKKSLPEHRIFFTVNSGSFYSKCKLCRGFKEYTISNKTINTELSNQGIKKCKFCRKIKPKDQFKAVGETRISEFCIECHNANKKDRRQYYSKYYHANKDHKKAYYKQWKENGGQELRVIVEQRRQSRKKSLEHSFSKQDWDNCKKFFNSQCAYCGKTLKRLTQDHVIPESKNGPYTVDNIVPACRSCNSSKNTMSLEEFLGHKDTFTDYLYERVVRYIASQSRAKLLSNQ